MLLFVSKKRFALCSKKVFSSARVRVIVVGGRRGSMVDARN